jgi:SAM-dependent methyltransferase
MKIDVPAAMLWPRRCPVCGAERCSVIIPPNYPEHALSQAELARIYRSSSEVKLMDRLVRCAECGCRYLSPCLNAREITQAYEDAVDPVFVSQNDFRIRTFRRTLAKLAKKFDIRPQSRILDIGCAGGAFPAAASQLGFSPTGVEPSRFMCEFARKEYALDIRPGTLEEQDFGEETFDVVTMWDVLEHLPRPAETLARISGLLRPGGLLVITYPDIDGIPARLMGRKWPFLLSVHLTYYTARTISRQLGDSFSVREISRHWQTLSLGYVLSRAGQSLPGLKGICRFLTWSADLCRLGELPVSYYLSQRLLAAVKT